MIIFFRIWSHGLQSHQRKSALWHYLYKFGRTNEKLLRFKGTLGVQAYCIPLINSKPYILPDHSRPIQVVIDPKVRKNSFVRVHPMFSRILKFLFVIGYFEKKRIYVFIHELKVPLQVMNYFSKNNLTPSWLMNYFLENNLTPSQVMNIFPENNSIL